MDNSYFLQMTRDCLGHLLMNKYVPDWQNKSERELQQIIDEMKNQPECNNSK